MDWVIKAIKFIASPLGSLAIQIAKSLVLAGIKLSPTKWDDKKLLQLQNFIREYISKGKGIVHLPLSVKEQNEIIKQLEILRQKDEVRMQKAKK